MKKALKTKRDREINIITINHRMQKYPEPHMDCVTQHFMYKYFGIEIKNRNYGLEMFNFRNPTFNMWTYYIHIPMHLYKHIDINTVDDLFHGGITWEQQASDQTMVLGCDYQHYYDIENETKPTWESCLADAKKTADGIHQIIMEKQLITLISRKISEDEI